MSEAKAMIQLETPTVRVTRWDLPPDSSTGRHVHGYDYIVVPVTKGALTVTSPDGDVVVAPLTIGGSYNRAAGVEHDVANRTDQAVAFVEIELLEHQHNPE